MSMDKRGDSWRFRIYKDGKTYTKTFKGTEKQAKKAHDLFRLEIERGEIGTNENMRMDELCALVYKDYVIPNCKVRTQRIYQQNYNSYILPKLGTMKISSIKPIHIQQLANELGKTLMPNTVNICMKCLRKSLSLAEKWQLIKESPYKHIELPKPQKTNHAELLSIDEIKTLLQHYSTETNLLHKTAFYLAIGCGLRNSEIRALTIDDIDLENGILTIDKQIAEIRNELGEVVEGVSSPKTTSSIRKIYIPDFIISILDDYINSLPFIPPSKQIFYSLSTGRPILKHTLSKRFRYTCESIGITPIRFHDLRHLQATLLIHSNINVQAISKRLGHSDIQTTLNVYTHSLDAVDKEVATSINNTFEDLSK